MNNKDKETGSPIESGMTEKEKQAGCRVTLRLS